MILLEIGFVLLVVCAIGAVCNWNELFLKKFKKDNDIQ